MLLDFHGQILDTLPSVNDSIVHKNYFSVIFPCIWVFFSPSVLWGNVSNKSIWLIHLFCSYFLSFLNNFLGYPCFIFMMYRGKRIREKNECFGFLDFSWLQNLGIENFLQVTLQLLTCKFFLLNMERWHRWFVQSVH